MLKCLFCGSDKIGEASYPRPTLFNGKKFSYKECRDCHLVFIDPIPAPDDYKVMYSSEYHSQFYFKDVAPDHTPLFDLVEKHVKTRSILDYGCGDGTFLKFFQSRGYQCTGVEFDPLLVKQLKEQNPGISFYTVDEFNSRNDLQFGVAYLGDVLEHLATPASFLRELTTRLEPDGLILVQGPLENNSNLALKMRKLTSGLVSAAGKKLAAHTPYHISFSNVDNQEMVFKNNGYTTLEYYQHETSWPYPNAASKNPFTTAKYLVARLSRSISKLNGGRSGNRFVYLGRKK